MTFDEIVEAIEAELLLAPQYSIDVESACASDLMSDVLVFTKTNMVLVTGLTNPQAIRTADMAEAPLVIFVRGKYPPKETLKLAEEMGIGVLLTGYTMFETAGLLYKSGLKGLGKLPTIRQER